MTMQKRIARSLDRAKSHYTVLVIGSGYGAGVAASPASLSAPGGNKVVRI